MMQGSHHLTSSKTGMETAQPPGGPESLLRNYQLTTGTTGPPARFIEEPTLADAIMDRLAASAHRIALTGKSLRKKKNH